MTLETIRVDTSRDLNAGAVVADAPAGIYYLKDAARYLCATDRDIRGKEVLLAANRIAGLSRKGFFYCRETSFNATGVSLSFLI